MLKALSDKGFWHFEFSQNHTKNRQNLTAKRTVRAKNPFGVRLQKMQKKDCENKEKPLKILDFQGQWRRKRDSNPRGL